MLEIVSALRACWEEKRRAVLATIVAVEGSVYQREGARCLINEDGGIVGIVSGGCVEKDLFEHARSVFDTGNSKLMEYDFRQGDDILWGLGLGCNGAVTLLLHLFDPVQYPQAAKHLLDAFDRRMSSDVPYVVGTVITSESELVVPVGYVVYGDEVTLAQDGSNTGFLHQQVKGVDVQLFVERVVPRQRLVIFGAGADVKPLTRAAKFLEWRVTVADHRLDLLNKENFPDADVFVMKREDYGNIPVAKSDAVVIMTHNYELDKCALGVLAQKDIAYLGQLGPRRRIERMLHELEAAGMHLEPYQLEKIHSPVGLDIGAETPEEIALCIVAEICARRNRRGGMPLREKMGPVNV